MFEKLISDDKKNEKSLVAENETVPKWPSVIKKFASRV